MNNFSCCEIWFHRYLTQCSINCRPKWRTKCDALFCCARYSPHWTQTGEVSLNRSHATYASTLFCCGTHGSIVNSTARASSSATWAISAIAVNESNPDTLRKQVIKPNFDCGRSFTKTTFIKQVQETPVKKEIICNPTIYIYIISHKKQNACIEQFPSSEI